MDQSENGDFAIPYEDIVTTVKEKFKYHEFEIISYSLNQIEERNGLLGEHGILRVTLQDARNISTVDFSFFVKLFPKYPGSAAFAEGVGAFEKESFIYSLFKMFKEDGISMVGTCVPRCYHTKEKEFLILDNLIEGGYETVNKHETLEYNMVSALLNFLSKMHASSLIYEEKRSTESPYRLINEYASDFEESFFNDRPGFVNAQGIQASIKAVVNEVNIFNFPDKLLSGESFKDAIEKVCYRIYDLVKPSTKFRNVVCHGDLWATNFLVKMDNNKLTGCKFVDFQCGRYAPPAHDVMSLFYLTTSRAFRRKHMYTLIGSYYSSLEKDVHSAGYKLAEMISFPEFLASCEEYKVFGIVQAAIYFPLILIASEAIEKYFSDKDLYQKTLFEDRSYLILEHMDKDGNYKERLIESITDLKQYCESQPRSK